jgi:hypothetical protein
MLEKISGDYGFSPFETCRRSAKPRCGGSWFIDIKNFACH